MALLGTQAPLRWLRAPGPGHSLSGLPPPRAVCHRRVLDVSSVADIASGQSFSNPKPWRRSAEEPCSTAQGRDRRRFIGGSVGFSCAPVSCKASPPLRIMSSHVRVFSFATGMATVRILMTIILMVESSPGFSPPPNSDRPRVPLSLDPFPPSHTPIACLWMCSVAWS